MLVPTALPCSALLSAALVLLPARVGLTFQADLQTLDLDPLLGKSLTEFREMLRQDAPCGFRFRDHAAAHALPLDTHLQLNAA